MAFLSLQGLDSSCHSSPVSGNSTVGKARLYSSLLRKVKSFFANLQAISANRIASSILTTGADSKIRSLMHGQISWWPGNCRKDADLTSQLSEMRSAKAGQRSDMGFGHTAISVLKRPRQTGVRQ